MFFKDKSVRSWIASLCFLMLVVGLICFLTFVQIPNENKDIITGIVGMIVGSISSSIAIFTGRDPDDLKTLKEEIVNLNEDRSSLISRLRDAQIDKDILRKQLEHLQSEIITRLSIFVGQEKLRVVGKVPQEIESWIPNEQPPPVSYTPQPVRPEQSGPPTPLPTSSSPTPPTNPPRRLSPFDDFIDEG